MPLLGGHEVAIRARLLQHGWDDELCVESFEPQPPGRGQVLVRVHACGVAYRDVIDRSGRVAFMQLPITPGHEAAGTIEAVGEGVERWRVGDRVATMHRDFCGACDRCHAGETSLCESAFEVFGLMVDGGYATHVTCHERALYRLPDGLLMPQAAVLLSAWGTAWRGLHQFGEPQSGARVLVTGANGGVGSAAVQLAARLGCTAWAVVRDARHIEFVERMGAQRVIVAEGRFDVGAWKADIALDCVGAATFNSSLRALRLGGGLVAIGNIADRKVDLSLGRVILGGVRIVGSSGATRRDMAQLAELWRRRGLEFAIADIVPLAEADTAMRRVRAGGLQGRIVLDCLAT